MDQQRQASLEKGNVVRLQLAAVRRQIKNGELDVAEFILTDDSGIKLSDVLLAIPRVSTGRCAGFYEQARVSSTLRLGGVNTGGYRPATPREREAIVDALSSAHVRVAA